MLIIYVYKFSKHRLFFSDVVNTCVVYIEQATAGGRGEGGGAAIYHRLHVRSYSACVSPFCFIITVRNVFQTTVTYFILFILFKLYM